MPKIYKKNQNLTEDEIPPSRNSTNKSASKKSEKSDTADESPPRECKSLDKRKERQKKTRRYVIKITIITLCLSLVFSFISEITASKANVIISMLLLMFLILVNIVFDGIGVAATSCDIVPLLAMSARKVAGAKIAVKLVKNAEKVANICSDVIGDICGIVSGACAVAIILKFTYDNPNTYLFNIILSSVVAALTVGGKAMIKDASIRNSQEMIMFASRILGVFYRPKK